ncbi:MAG: DUF1801 domain-containing protein [Patescibacteria group bacterium]
MPTKENFSSNIRSEFQEIFDRITQIIHEANDQLTCEVKWNRLTYGLSQDYHHWICSIDQTKKSLNLIFHFGGLLNDPNNHFIVGTSLFLRKLEYKSIDEVDEKIITNFVKQAINKLGYFKENWKRLSQKK